MARYAIDRLKPINEKKIDIGANADTKEVMNLLFRLDTLNRILKGAGTWLEAEYLEGSQVQLIREGIMKTNLSLKRHAVAYTYALSYDEELIDSMLAPTDG